jgi:hypothetical protein
MAAGIIKPALLPLQESCKPSISVVALTTNRELTGKDTLDNPRCFKNDQTGFAAGGYHGVPGYSDGCRWSSEESKSPGMITKGYASFIGKASLGGTYYTTRAKIVFSYLYGLTVNPGSLTATGSPDADGKQTWQAATFNTTPYIAKDVHLKAYLVQDGKYTLVANTTTDIGPRLQGNGRGGVMTPTATWNLAAGVKQDGVNTGQVVWTFKAPAPTKDYKVLVSADVSFTESGGASTKPLKTVVAYGHNYNNVSGLTGTKMEVAPFMNTPGNNAPGGNKAYIDNYTLSGQQAGLPPGPPPTLGLDDLAVTDMPIDKHRCSLSGIKPQVTATTWPSIMTAVLSPSMATVPKSLCHRGADREGGRHHRPGRLHRPQHRPAPAL